MNAAYGIGMQVSNAAYSFSQNFMTALNPQITKSYALGDFAYLSTLVLRGARFSFLPVVDDSRCHIAEHGLPALALAGQRA